MSTDEQFTQILERMESLSETVSGLTAKIDSIDGKCNPNSELENFSKTQEDVARLRDAEIQRQIETPLYIIADESGFIGCHKSRANREINLPDNLLAIRADSFSFCVNLEYLVIPASVKSIGKKFCFRCLHLKSVKFLGPCPEGLEDAFEECWRLKEILVLESDLTAYQEAIPKHLSSIKAY